MAVTAAHITHMLRDTFDDVQAGYFNIPREVLDANHIGPKDLHSDAYRSWIQNRIQLARTYFRAGRQYLSRVENLRCRFACFAYVERFEWLLDTIERKTITFDRNITSESASETGCEWSPLRCRR